MDKRTFIQQVVIHYRCKPDDVGRAVEYGEALWDAISRAGYGDQKQPEHKTTRDYYAELLPDQKECFDRFWQAFQYRKGKQRAAMRWGVINPEADLTRLIVHGAEWEARNRSDKGTPKMAEGWLSERRWEDAPPPKSEATTPANKHAGLVAELHHARAMFDRLGVANGTPAEALNFWSSQIARLEKELTGV